VLRGNIYQLTRRDVREHLNFLLLNSLTLLSSSLFSRFLRIKYHSTPTTIRLTQNAVLKYTRKQHHSLSLSQQVRSWIQQTLISRF
jgi:hypothetical protein